MYIVGDIHNVIKTIPNGSIDLIYTSPPYGITEAKWDKKLNWKLLFEEMWRVLKPTGIIILHASMPFSYELLKYETPKYNYIWLKNNNTGFFQAKFQPLRITEDVYIYYRNKGTYNVQMKGEEIVKSKYYIKKKGESYFGNRSQNGNGESHKGKYPNTLLTYPIRKKSGGITRVDEMIDFFIKTYSNETETILDMTCCNRIVGNRCEQLNRKYIGVDINPEFISNVVI